MKKGTTSIHHSCQHAAWPRRRGSVRVSLVAEVGAFAAVPNEPRGKEPLKTQADGPFWQSSALCKVTDGRQHAPLLSDDEDVV